jgi:tRNA pseudouridine38-40 synthase
VTGRHRRIRIELAYDGTDFAGWQVQPDLRTVQGTVETALSRILGGATARLRGAGRTDAGVHARGQVADALVDTRLDDPELLIALASLLPADVRPVDLRMVPDDFHSRKLALSKTYVYRLDRSRWGNPLDARYTLHYPYEIDRDAMQEALGKLPGRRDWAGFAGSASAVESTVRDLAVASYEEPGPDSGRFTFRADGFLNHMVRNLVGTLLDVARGRFPPGRIDEILRTGDRTLAGPTAPARGLCLEEVFYPPLLEAGEERRA